MRIDDESHCLYRLGSRLRFLRKMLGLSQTRFATALGLHRNTIGRYERGSHRVPDRVVKQIETVYALEFSRIRAKNKISGAEAVHLERWAYHWEEQQSKRKWAERGEQDRERYNAEVYEQKLTFMRWCPSIHLPASFFLVALADVQDSFLPPAETTLYRDLSTVLAVIVFSLSACLLVWQIKSFVKQKGQFYPRLPAFPRKRSFHERAWKSILGWLQNLTDRLLQSGYASPAGA